MRWLVWLVELVPRTFIKSQRTSSFAIAWIGARLDASSLIYSIEESGILCLISFSFLAVAVFFLSTSTTVDTKDAVYLILWLMAHTESLKFPICFQVTFVLLHRTCNSLFLSPVFPFSSCPFYFSPLSFSFLFFFLSLSTALLLETRICSILSVTFLTSLQGESGFDLSTTTKVMF